MPRVVSTGRIQSGFSPVPEASEGALAMGGVGVAVAVGVTEVGEGVGAGEGPVVVGVAGGVVVGVGVVGDGGEAMSEALAHTSTCTSSTNMAEGCPFPSLYTFR